MEEGDGEVGRGEGLDMVLGGGLRKKGKRLKR
jgi:hypothetical protein